MSFSCPHCSEPIKDAVSQTTHRERLAAKDSTIAEITAQRDEATVQATSAAARIAKAEQVAVSAAYTMAGVADDAVIRRGFEIFHREATSALPEGERPTLAEWITSEAARSHPMLSTHYAEASPSGTPSGSEEEASPTTAAPPAAPAQGVTPAPSGPPSGDEGAVSPPAKAERLTPEALRDYLRSDAYRALPAEKQREEFARLKGEVGVPDLFNGRENVRSVLPKSTQ